MRSAFLRSAGVMESLSDAFCRRLSLRETRSGMAPFSVSAGAAGASADAESFSPFLRF